MIHQTQDSEESQKISNNPLPYTKQEKARETQKNKHT